MLANPPNSTSSSGSPTVIVEAGASSFAIDFALVQPEVARTTRVCSYDRAGSGLENCGLRPVAVSVALHQLEYAGWFRRIDALLLGRSSAPDASSESALTYTEAVRQAIGHLDCPVLMDVDVGHRAPQMTLVQGAVASVTWSETEKGVVTQQLV